MAESGLLILQAVCYPRYRSDSFYATIYAKRLTALLSLPQGHPLGATGLAQCFELVTQLRGEAGARQVENARNGLQQNIGLGGASLVAIYRLGFPEKHQLKMLLAKL